MKKLKKAIEGKLKENLSEQNVYLDMKEVFGSPINQKKITVKEMAKAIPTGIKTLGNASFEGTEIYDKRTGGNI